MEIFNLSNLNRRSCEDARDISSTRPNWIEKYPESVWPFSAIGHSCDFPIRFQKGFQYRVIYGANGEAKGLAVDIIKAADNRAPIVVPVNKFPSHYLTAIHTLLLSIYSSRTSQL
jgi:hypothetical protein